MAGQTYVPATADLPPRWRLACQMIVRDEYGTYDYERWERHLSRPPPLDPKRKGGVKVKTVQELVEKLKNEAGVI